MSFDGNENTNVTIKGRYYILNNNKILYFTLGDIQIGEADTYEAEKASKDDPIVALEKEFIGRRSGRIYDFIFARPKGKPNRLIVTIGGASYQYKQKAAATQLPTPPPAKAATAPIRAETLLALERVVSSIMLQ